MRTPYAYVCARHTHTTRIGAWCGGEGRGEERGAVGAGPRERSTRAHAPPPSSPRALLLLLLRRREQATASVCEGRRQSCASACVREERRLCVRGWGEGGRG
eukprot:1651263-Rhodomonas_salina.2